MKTDWERLLRMDDEGIDTTDIPELDEDFFRCAELLVPVEQAVTLDLEKINNKDIPDFRLHPLKGAMRGRWSIMVNGNWRLTFEFRDGNAYVLDYEDYH